MDVSVGLAIVGTMGGVIFLSDSGNKPLYRVVGYRALLLKGPTGKQTGPLL